MCDFTSFHIFIYPLVMTNIAKMTIEIVDFPIKHGDFPYSYVSLPEGIFYLIISMHQKNPPSTDAPALARHKPWLRAIARTFSRHLSQLRWLRGSLQGRCIEWFVALVVGWDLFWVCWLLHLLRSRNLQLATNVSFSLVKKHDADHYVYVVSKNSVYPEMAILILIRIGTEKE